VLGGEIGKPNGFRLSDRVERGLLAIAHPCISYLTDTDFTDAHGLKRKCVAFGQEKSGI
jgi:hypothetical protein